MSPKRSRVALVAVAALISGLLVSSSAADPRLLEVVSTGPSGGNGASAADFAGVSADGSHTFFTTTESLTSDDTDSSVDIYGRSKGTTTLVSTGSRASSASAGDPTFWKVSEDGGRVLFEATENLTYDDQDICPPVSFNCRDVYERSGNKTRLISTGPASEQASMPASFVGASADATHVLFITSEQLVSTDTNGSEDLYERVGDQTRLVNMGPIAPGFPFGCCHALISQDGSRVLFDTSASLDGADSDDCSTQADTRGCLDVYEWSNGTTTLLSAGDGSCRQRCANGSYDSYLDGASADGTRVFFSTRGRLVSDDTDDSFDVYEHAGGTTSLISTAVGGSTSDASFIGISRDETHVFFRLSDIPGGGTIYERSNAITSAISVGEAGQYAPDAEFNGASQDGTYVFFTTRESLVPDDTDGGLDIYERSSGTTKLVSASGDRAVYPLFGDSSADGTRVFFYNPFDPLDQGGGIYERLGGALTLVGVGFFDAVSRDGRRVFFTTSQSLLPSDTDDQPDVYAASVADPPGPPPAPLPPPVVHKGFKDVTRPTVSLSSHRKQKLRNALRHGLRMSVRCSEACTIHVSATLSTGALVVGRASQSLQKAGEARLLVKFTRKARKRLRRARSARLTLRARVNDAAGNLTVKTQPIALVR